MDFDRFNDPASNIDLCECGTILGPDDGEECWECRVKNAETHTIPAWPLILGIFVILAWIALTVPVIVAGMREAVW